MLNVEYPEITLQATSTTTSTTVQVQVCSMHTCNIEGMPTGVVSSVFVAVCCNEDRDMYIKGLGGESVPTAGT